MKVNCDKLKTYFVNPNATTKKAQNPIEKDYEDKMEQLTKIYSTNAKEDKKRRNKNRWAR